MQHDDTDFADLSDLLRFDQPRPKPKRRSDPRLLTIFRVGKLTTDRFEELCIVRNVGAGGMMAHVHSPLRARQRVRIELTRDRKFWGNILWIKEGAAGIGFDSEVDIEEVLAREDSRRGDRRATGPRLTIDCKARLLTGAGYHSVRVNDLGQCGARVTTPETVEVGQEVVITLEGFRPVRGSAQWCRDGRLGIAFNKPIPLDELTRWLQDMFGSSSVALRSGPAESPVEHP